MKQLYLKGCFFFIFLALLSSTAPSYSVYKRIFGVCNKALTAICPPTRFNGIGPLNVPAQSVLNRKGSSHRIIAELVIRRQYQLGNPTDPANTNDATELIKQAYTDGAHEINWFMEEPRYEEHN